MKTAESRSKEIYLLIGVHNHQPVGNFPSVLEKAYQAAYLPFLESLERHPHIKVTLHYSGVLLQWLEKNHPSFLEKIGKLVKREQIEIMSGGFYEPILSLIPDRDKFNQIKMLNQYIGQRFSYSPRGIWLAERIWEPHLAKVISEAGLDYTILDESHFIFAGLEKEDIFGYYLTEEQGKMIRVFPISKELRYLIPFRLPEQTIDYLERLREKKSEPIITIADDGEKFGLWPGTYQWVYEKGWLERFFTLLEDNKDWIKLLTFSQCLGQFYPQKLIYFPTASYDEMMEWALSYSAGIKYEEMVQELSSQKKWKDYQRFFKGGFFRNFFFKYPEANWMHKKMLQVSEKVERASQVSKESAVKASDELWQGQCNCAYWHGVFGGLYLTHLREAVYQHLIQAEKISERILYKEENWTEGEIGDFDQDGKPEILLANALINLYIDPQEGGGLWELDYKPKALNLLNILSRRPEVYHQKLREAEEEKKETEKGVPSIHELSRAKDKNLEQLLNYDWYKRASFLDHFLGSETTLRDFSRCKYEEKGDFVNQPYLFALRRKDEEAMVKLERKGGVWVGEEFLPLTVKKKIGIKQASSIITVKYELVNLSQREISLWFGVELNLLFLDPESVRVNWGKDKDRKNTQLSSFSSLEEVREIELEDISGKVSLYFTLEKPLGIWQFPLNAVSQSEAGFEKSYQGTSFLFHQKVKLEAGKSWEMKIENAISCKP